MSNLMLALDGPLNGQYVTAESAVAHGYMMDEWPNDEDVLVHGGLLSTTAKEIEDHYFPPEPDPMGLDTLGKIVRIPGRYFARVLG